MNWSYRLGWLFFRTAFSTYFRWQVHHPEHVPVDGPVILAANHANFIDPPLVGAGIRRMVNFLARNTLFDVPVVGVPTIESMKDSGATCICLTAGKTLMFDREAMVKLADKHKIAILAA